VLPPTPQGSNGRLPGSELTGVGDGERMYTPAARQFRRMDAAATAAGHPLHVNSGYRTYGEQAALYRAYLNGTGNLAAPPGHSTHGLGLSADIQVTDPTTLHWLRAHAGTYGFVDDVPSEAWHWTWRP
jgi:LAS superfamily LD-carboxypeptidase LdcB